MFNLINVAIKILCYIPFVYLISFYTFVFRSFLKIGRLPSYGNPDPKELGFTLHRAIIYTIFDLVIYGIMIFLVLIAITLITKKFAVKKFHLISFFIGITLIILHLFCDPLDTWFLD